MINKRIAFMRCANISCIDFVLIIRTLFQLIHVTMKIATDRSKFILFRISAFIDEQKQ